MAITLSKSAAGHIRTMLEKRGYGLGLRLGTRESGCSGFSYVVNYADTVTDDDVMFEDRGVMVVVARQNLPLIDGTEIDYLKNNAIEPGFEFHNPNVKDLCGCGESFNV